MAAGLSAVTGLAMPAWSHSLIGRVDPPQPVPALRVLGADGRTAELADLLRTKVCALQLMFTGCSATCPIQGAVFADLQRRLDAAAPAHWQLLSLSIDPLGDDARALAQWLRRFEARPARWAAAVVEPPHLDALLDFVSGRADGADRHTANVYLFDRRARLVFRTAEMPPAASVLALMQDIDRLG